MAKYPLPQSDIIRAYQFSEGVIPTLPYLRNRNQEDLEIIKYQIIIGKLGELGAKKWLEDLGEKCSEVDFEITENKTYAPDLMINEEIHCHVKSQDLNSARTFGLSWTFQFSGNGIGHTDSRIFEDYNENDVVIFCLVNGSLVYIKAKIPVKKIHELDLFKEPRKESLAGIKKVVYFEDIPEDYRV